MLRSSKFLSAVLLAGPLSTGCAEEVELGHLGDAATGAATGSTAGGPGGAGGGGPGSGGSAGSSTSTACASLTLSGDPITLASASAEDRTNPVLVQTAATEPGQVGSVALAFGSRDLRSGCNPKPECIPSAVTHASFSAWGTWPANLGRAATFSPVGGATLAAGPGATANAFALLWNDAADILPPMPPEELRFAPDVFPSSVLAEVATVPLTQHGRPLFVSPGPSSHLVAFETTAESSRYMHIHFVADGVSSTIFPSGCGNEALAADAVHGDGGWIVALTTDPPFNACLLDDGIPGPPTAIQLGFISDGPNPIWSFGSVIPSEERPPRPDGVHAVRLAPRSDGAWVVFQFDGDSALVRPPITAVRVDTKGMLIPDSSIQVSPDGSAMGSFTVTHLGDKLVVGWVDTVDPSAPLLIVQVFDESGKSAGAASFSSPGWYSATGFSLLGGPSGDQLLVAWPSAEDPGGPAAIHVARYDCAD